MLDWFCYAVGITLALVATAIVAFPDQIFPDTSKKKKRVGARQWGVYHGRPAVAPDGEEGIEVRMPARKQRAVVGSQTYAGGRGVSMKS